MAGDSQSADTDDDSRTYVSTPNGLISASGRWYHIPEDELREYADGVLDHVSMNQLIRWADAWIDSSRAVGLWILPALLWMFPGEWAVAAMLGVYLTWSLLSPVVPTLLGAWLATGLENVFLQGVYYVLVLSLFAGMERFVAVGLGLIAFVLFRWGIVDWVFRVVVRPVRQWMYPLPIPDQVLRGLIVRAALKYRVSVPQVDAMTEDIIENWTAGETSSDDSKSRASR